MPFLLCSRSLLGELVNEKVAETAALVADWWLEEDCSLNTASALIYSLSILKSSTVIQRNYRLEFSTSWCSWQIQKERQAVNIVALHTQAGLPPVLHVSFIGWWSNRCYLSYLHPHLCPESPCEDSKKRKDVRAWHCKREGFILIQTELK